MAAKKKTTEDENSAESPPNAKEVSQKKRAKAEDATEAETNATSPATKKAKKNKKPVPEPVTEIDPTTRKELDDATPRFKVVSWNVDGLRAPGRREALDAIVKAEAPDVLFLQETKLQEKDIEEWKDALVGYTSHWSCSQKAVKLGYAGVAAFVKSSLCDMQAAPASGKISSFFTKKKPDGDVKDKDGAKPSTSLVSVTKGIGPANTSFGVDYQVNDCHGDTDLAGRSLTLEFGNFVLVTLYVPNSGQKLENLDRRCDVWDPALRQYCTNLETKTKKPVVVCGDLNVAYKELDVYNYFAKHAEKTAGCTTRERDSFAAWLEGGYTDALRHQYPEARGLYTYWSVRAGNRPTNKGLRLDYFICSNVMFGESDASKGATVYDSFTMPDATTCSDHCPVGLVLNV